MNVNYEINFQPVGRRVQVEYGAKILDVARDYGIGIASLCGSKGTCGKCKVRIASGEVSPIDDREKKSLTDEELRQGYRLACLTKVHGDIKVEIPVESIVSSQRVHLAGAEKDTALDPIVKIISINLPCPSREDNQSDQLRLRNYLAQSHGLKDISVDIFAQRRLSALLRNNDWQAKIAIHDNEVVAAVPAGESLLGLAIDLGTTSIAAYLTNMETGEVLSAKGLMNPQIAYGEDVVARITYVIDNDGKTLQKVVVGGINNLIGEMCSEAGCALENIAEVVLVGNTVMHHLLLGLPVKQLIMAPYIPAISDSIYTKARDIGINVSSSAYVYTMPNIAGFVGADHVAMLLGAGIKDRKGVTIGIDIGTNTEITLSANGNLSSCSCASGPAFEGAHIKHGMRAVAGAIEKVTIDGDTVMLQTINDQPPVGLCGSGILDAVGQLLAGGITGKMGKLKSHPYVRETEEGKAFVLATGDKSGTGKDIILSEKDISEIQLAKGAIASGINILLEQAEIHWSDIDEFVIAGAFGTYIDVGSAISIGMLPPLPLERFSQVGNSAGMGAKLALISKTQRQTCMDIAQQVNYVELTSFSTYPKIFAKCLRFAPSSNWTAKN